jgi:uncharacterized protein YcbX
MDEGAPPIVGRVAEVWRFPVKSMLGEQLDRVEITAGGVVGDRSWALVDAEDGKVGRAVRLTSVAPASTVMEEAWPDVEGLAPESFIARTRIPTPVPEDVVSDITMAMAAPAGTFFDLTVLHLLTTSTLDELARQHSEGAWDVRRYRPNVLVETYEEGFVENGWVGRKVVLGRAAAMQVALPTMRCIMTTLAQEDLPRDPSLLRTVAAANRLEIAGLGTWACAGVYGDAAAPGIVSVGDAVRVDAP